MKRSRHDDNLEYRARMGLLSKAAYSSDPVKSRDFGYRKNRSAGPTLKPGDVPELVASALASGLIKPGEAFEHLLAVVCDDYRYHALHFIVASPRTAGARRRAVLLSTRTVNGSVEFVQNELYFQRLVDYATALGSVRVIVHDVSFCSTLTRFLVRLPPNSLKWYPVNLQRPPECEELRHKYEDGYALAFDLYRQAVAAKVIKCPDIDTLPDQIARMAPTVDTKGRMALTKPGARIERELEALCLLCFDEDLERLAGYSEAERQGDWRLELTSKGYRVFYGS